MEESLTSRSLRISFDFDKFAKDNSGSAKRFKDISACARYYIELGRNAEKIIEMQKDPEKLKEFEGKMSHIITKGDTKKVLETMSEDEIDSFVIYAQTLKKQKVQQFLDMVTKS